MTQRFTTGQAFTSGDQVTAQKLEDIVEKATPLTALTDDTSLTVSSGAIEVKTSTGAANGITLPKIAHQPANTILVNNNNSVNEVTALEVTDEKIVIGDGTGFTAAKLSGNATMTNAGVVAVSGVASGATGTTASANDNSTKLSTTEYVDRIALPNIKVAQQTAASTVSGTTSYTDFPGLSVTITPRSENSDFIINTSAILGVASTQLMLGKIQYQVNSGSFADVVSPDSPSSRTEAHGVMPFLTTNSEYGNTMNIQIMGQNLSYSLGNTLTFKLQVKNYLNSYALYFNRTNDDSDTARKFRGVSTISVEEIPSQ